MSTAVLEAAEKSPPQKVTTVEGITEYRFANGFSLLLYPDDSKPTVTVNLTIFVGSRHEGYGEAGMAHLLEHMLFKGAPDHPNIPKLLQDAGARFNGTTWVDRTNYYETLPASDANLELALRLEADRMLNSFVRAEDLASEMTVVRNEFERGENSPSRVLNQRMMAVAYEWHNYGKSTIGNKSDIERVPITKLREFYKRFYQPDNAMLVIAGAFNQDKALKLVDELFGSMPKPERVLDTTYTEEPPQDGERNVTLRRVGDVALAATAYHVPAGSHPDFAAVEALSSILSIEPAGRLYKALVETKKAVSAGGGSFAFHDPGLMYMMAEVRKENSLDDAKDTLIAEIEKIGDEGVTQEEVDRVKTLFRKEREQELADTSSVAVELSNWAAQGDWRLYFLHRDRMEQVTPADVQRVAKQYCQRNNRTVGLFIPTEAAQRVTVPPNPDIQALVKDYKGREGAVAGEAFDVAPLAIEARTTRTAFGGVKAALLPKKTRGEAVQLSLTLRYGDENSLRGFEEATRVLPSLMTRGTKELTHQQLQDALDKNLTTLRASGTPGEMTFDIQTKGAMLPEALGLLKQVLREPALDPAEFEVVRQEQLARLEQFRNEPQALAPVELSRALSPYPAGDIRYVPTIEERIERFQELDVGQVQAVYTKMLSSQAGELAIVGDFDPETIAPIVEEMLADWSAPAAQSRIHRKAGDKPAVTREVVTPDKANAAYFAGFDMALKDSDPDYPALVLGNFILGGGSLASRLGDRVRQKEGLSYSVASQFNADAIDPVGRLTVYAIANPVNAGRLTEVIREELDRLLAEGVTPEEVERAKQGYLQSQQVRRASDSALAGTLAGSLDADRTLQFQADLEKKISTLTAEQVTAAVQKHWNLKRLSVITAGDFKKPAE
jgi:zinc protease